jgi:hypothetical protein
MELIVLVLLYFEWQRHRVRLSSGGSPLKDNVISINQRRGVAGRFLSVRLFAKGGGKRKSLDL